MKFTIQFGKPTLGISKSTQKLYDAMKRTLVVLLLEEVLVAGLVRAALRHDVSEQICARAKTLPTFSRPTPHDQAQTRQH